MQKKLFLIIILTFLSFNCALAASTFVAQVPLNPDLKPEHATNFTTIADKSAAGYGNFVLQLVAGSLIYIAGPLAVLMIAFGGWSYVNARGDQTKLEEAKKTLIWAALGLAAIIISYSVVSIVINLILGTTNTVQPASPPTNSPAIEENKGSQSDLQDKKSLPSSPAKLEEQLK